MNLLVVMAHYPFPLNTGGAIVAYNIIKRLSRKHSISITCFQPEGSDVLPLDFVERLEWIPRCRKSRLRRWLCYLKCVLLGLPYSVESYSSKRMEASVKADLATERADAIILFDISAVQYCPPSSFGKVFIIIEDPHSLKLRRMIKLPVLSIGKKIGLLLMSKFIALYEKEYLYKMNRVFLLSQADAIDVEEMGLYGAISHLTYGVEHRNIKDVIKYEDRERVIVFSGNMYHPPNIDGALFFLLEVFPVVLQKNPNAVLWIVGDKPDNRIYRAAKQFGKNVVITGKVPDVSDYVKRATVSICPIRLKIGVQTKILEALSWGTPVVTTSSGNSGVGGVSGEHLWVEDEPRAFAEKVCDLIQGKDWKTISQKGREMVSERFSWERGVEQFEQYIDELKATKI